jgi:electron transport complex protein RnfB
MRGMASNVTNPLVALIDERACIGCALCVPACPVDAIVGAQRLMHTVIAAECTGCRLCLPPCPVDCIRMVGTGETWTHEQRKLRAGQYRRRHAARRARLERERAEQQQAEPARTTEEKKRAAIERAMMRARERLSAHQKKS